MQNSIDSSQPSFILHRMLRLVAFTGLLQSGDAVLSAPGPVSSANLESLGADSFRVSFDPPASDGGSDITSYLVRTA